MLKSSNYYLSQRDINIIHVALASYSVLVFRNNNVKDFFSTQICIIIPFIIRCAPMVWGVKKQYGKVGCIGLNEKNNNLLC